MPMYLTSRGRQHQLEWITIELAVVFGRSGAVVSSPMPGLRRRCHGSIGHRQRGAIWWQTIGSNR